MVAAELGVDRLEAIGHGHGESVVVAL